LPGLWLVDVLTGFADLLCLLVALINFSVVIEVGEELTPCDEFFVADVILALGQLHALVHFVSLNLCKNLVQCEYLCRVHLSGNLHCFCINKVNYPLVCPQFHDQIATLENFIIVFI
jgi:hypothetical protein